MKLENEYLLVEIARLGAEVTRIFDKETKTEILWEGDPKYWKRHSPILFPNVGKMYQNTMRIGDVQYPACQHGFARDMVFTCINESETNASFMMSSTEETQEVYPYEFELHIRYTLNEKELLVQWLVKNRGDETMYFTIGGHPAFRFAKAGETKADYMLKFPGKERLICIGLDKATGTALPEKPAVMELIGGTYPVTEEMFAADTLIFDGGQIEEAWLCHRDGSPYVGVRCPGYSNFGIWSVKDSPFVCLEPWAGRCDNRGFEDDISKKPGINSLDAGDVFKKQYSIVVA
jgi:galactose mutarotase-like enzyme